MIINECKYVVEKTNKDKYELLIINECDIPIGFKLQFARDKFLEVKMVDCRYVVYIERALIDSRKNFLASAVWKF